MAKFSLYKIGSNEDKYITEVADVNNAHCLFFLTGWLNCLANGKEVVFKGTNKSANICYTIDCTDYEIRYETEETTKTQLMNALQNMLEQADEDCPVEYRTDHFRDALADGWALINTLNKDNKLKTGQSEPIDADTL